MKQGNIYLLKSYHETYGDLYKIGLTKNEVNSRLLSLKTGNPNDILIIETYQTSIKPSALEARLHRRYNHLRISGEWFELTQDDVNDFLIICKQMEDALKLIL